MILEGDLSVILDIAGISFNKEKCKSVIVERDSDRIKMIILHLEPIVTKKMADIKLKLLCDELKVTNKNAEKAYSKWLSDNSDMASFRRSNNQLNPARTIQAMSGFDTDTWIISIGFHYSEKITGIDK